MVLYFAIYATTIVDLSFPRRFGISIRIPHSIHVASTIHPLPSSRMTSTTLENVTPQVFAKSGDRVISAHDLDENIPDVVDAREIFDLIRDINDPEHPLTLEQLNVVREAHIDVSKDQVVILHRVVQSVRIAFSVSMCNSLRQSRIVPWRR